MATRPEIQVNGPPLPVLDKIAGTKLVLKGEGSSEIEVTDGAKKLVEYLKLPASEYSTNVLKGFNNKINRIDSKTFSFEMDKIKILSNKIRPIITAVVDVDSANGGTTLLVNNLKLVADDPKVQEQLDKSYTISCRNQVQWEPLTSPGTSRMFCNCRVQI